MPIHPSFPGVSLRAHCPFCGRDDVSTRPSGVSDVMRIDCHLCGQFDVKFLELVAELSGWEYERKSALSCATRQAFEDGLPLKILSGVDAARFAESHTQTRIADNQVRLLKEVAKRARRPMVAAEFRPAVDFTIIDSLDEQEFSWYCASLANEGLVELDSSGDTLNVTLSVRGWNQVQPLPRQGGIPGRCFVAMSFDERLGNAYRDGIGPAVSRAGFKPIRIDQKEHNGDITDEIMAGIRDAQFVIADFTLQRPGVYYEAGFALGLGRPVIWCCRGDERDKLHFDTDHMNHILWDTPEDLQERLVNRIKATIIDQR